MPDRRLLKGRRPRFHISTFPIRDIRITVFCLELCHRWVYLGREEGEQEVQVVDEQRVRYDVPALQR